MSDSASPSALLDARAASGPSFSLQAGLVAAASLATALVIFGLCMLVSAQKHRDAGRMIVQAQKSDGYVATIVNGFAAIQGHPRGF